jgi:hypothetical protein
MGGAPFESVFVKNDWEEGVEALIKAEVIKRSTSPLFNDRKMKFATFCINLSALK